MVDRISNTSLGVSQPVDLLKRGSEEYYNYPISPASNLCMEVLAAGGENIEDLPARKKQINHNVTYEVLEQEERRLVSMQSDSATVTVELSDIDKITGSNKPAKKLFVLSTIEINKQALHDGMLTQDYISFPLQSLVDIGFYGAIQSARKGFKTGMDALTSMKIKGVIKKGKKNTCEVEALRVLFTGADIERGQCVIYLNPHIDWSFVAQYFTVLPQYYFRLSNRASDLLYYIFYLARQNTKSIETQGYFTISNRALQQKLLLPDENTIKNPQRDIIEAVEKAIEEIEEAQKEHSQNTDLSLMLIYNELEGIKDFLASGYLKVSFKGVLRAKFTTLSKDRAQKIKETKQRSEQRKQRAITKNMEKALKKALEETLCLTEEQANAKT